MADVKYIPIKPVWVEMMLTKDTPEKQVAFICAIFDYALKGTVPKPPKELESPRGVDYAARDAYLAAKEHIDFMLMKARLASKGGAAGKGVSRNKGNQNASKRKRLDAENDESEPKQYQTIPNSTESIAEQYQDNTNQYPKDKVKDKDKVKVKESCSPIGEQNARAKEPRAEIDEIVSQSCRPPNLPTDYEMQMYCSNVNVPKDYLPTFLRRMEQLGWEYVNYAGSVIRLNKRNFKSLLRSFYERDKERKEMPLRANRANNQPEGVVYHEEGYDLSDFKPHEEE